MNNAKQAVLQIKYARIIKAFAEKAHLTYEQAMDIFYNSDIFRLINEGVADLHCRSDLYLINELWADYNESLK